MGAEGEKTVWATSGPASSEGQPDIMDRFCSGERGLRQRSWKHHQKQRLVDDKQDRGKNNAGLFLWTRLRGSKVDARPQLEAEPLGGEVQTGKTDLRRDECPTRTALRSARGEGSAGRCADPCKLGLSRRAARTAQSRAGDPQSKPIRLVPAPRLLPQKSSRRWKSLGSRPRLARRAFSHSSSVQVFRKGG